MACERWCQGRHGRFVLHRSTLAIAVIAASALAPGPVALLCAQTGPRRVVQVPLVAVAIRDLTFGTVLAGISTSVSVHDPYHAGVFEVDGPPGASVRIECALPTALVGGGGQLLPIAFRSGDGFVDVSPSGFVFDPHGPVITSLDVSGRLLIRMGGVVSPDRAQPTASYHATISMTVYTLGS